MTSAPRLVCAVAAAVALLLLVPASQQETPIPENPRFRGDVVVFYPEHPDDETLLGASAIRAALAQKGPENVYVVLVSQGRGVATLLPGPALAGMTPAEIGARRAQEFRRATRALGLAASHVTVLPDVRPGPADNLAEMRATALRFERSEALAGRSVTHVAHTYAFDANPMHRANGRVLKRLSDAGLVHDALFWVDPFGDVTARRGLWRFQALTTTDARAVRAALEAYRRADPRSGLDAIGYRSAPWHFVLLASDRYLTSYLHTAAVPD
ncbi:GlcNAc-PI de-N-acetylase [Georgenia soli]|uniref:GlcNAc-PI de-N-acetylase n=1 Tax=Georgenia soli TaxID=638953 RepID=A0A2A9EL08_9MICO|nr:PIG-L family deacetylase [Georgenia soli]PFG39221.1 GlcNAc-PI de-N-acetylase [Georgenia soli]